MICIKTSIFKLFLYEIRIIYSIGNLLIVAIAKIAFLYLQDILNNFFSRSDVIGKQSDVRHSDIKL